MLTIQEIRNLEPDTEIKNPSMKAMVIDVGEIEPATERTKAKFFSILADCTGAISCTCYCTEHKSKFIKGMGIVIMNVLIKQSYVAVTERSDVALCRSFNIPEAIMETAPRLPSEPHMNIKMALNSPVKTMTGIKGKVVKVFAASSRTVNDEEMPFQDIEVKDKHGRVTVSLWNNFVDTLNKGSLIKLTKCRVRLYDGEKKLTTTKQTAFEVVSEDVDLQDISDEEEDDHDADSNITHKELNLESGAITEIFSVDPYMSCPNRGCNNTKLITILENNKYIMQCKKCKARCTASAANAYLRATVFFETADKSSKVAIFLPQIKEIFQHRGVEFNMSFDQTELQQQLFDILTLFDIDKPSVKS